jgi:two-component system CheB/CheR fusion protein
VKLSVGREDDFAVVRVGDDGVGIAPDMLENVFELFVQSRRTLDRSEGGIGVGLTLVRSLVTMHGGEVTAKSDGAGKGTELTVRLPLARAEQPERTGRPRHRNESLPSGAKIVIVDDSVDSCAMLCELLSLSNFACEAAYDGTSALDLITRSRPQAAIVDVGLPGMDGFEVARRVRAEPHGKDILLIALTGYGQPSDRARALESGFDEHIVKPVQPDQLLRLLGRGEKHTNGASADGAEVTPSNASLPRSRLS